MSELSIVLSLFKGTRTTQEIADGAGVSRETFRKLERGLSVKLSTLQDISKYLKLTRTQWLTLMVAWIKGEVGADATSLQIVAADAAPAMPRDVRQLQELALQLSPAERQQAILALSRPEVRISIAAINRLYEDLKAHPASQTRRPKP